MWDVRTTGTNSHSFCNGGLQCMMHVVLIAHVLNVALLCEAPLLKRRERLSLLRLNYVQQASCLMSQIGVGKKASKLAGHCKRDMIGAS